MLLLSQFERCRDHHSRCHHDVLVPAHVRPGYASFIADSAGLVWQMIQRPRMDDDEALRQLPAQIMELGIGTDTVAMMCDEPTSLGKRLEDRRDCGALRRRHPMAGASE